MLLLFLGAMWATGNGNVVLGLLLIAVLVAGVWLWRRYSSLKTPTAQQLAQRLAAVGAMSGAQFEIFMADLFRAMGYRATVLGGSGDQGVDIVLRATDGLVAVQCKNYKKAIGNTPVKEVFAGAKHHHCQHAWVVAPAGYTKGAFELAGSVGVSHFDAGAIQQWIKQVDKAEQERERAA